MVVGMVGIGVVSMRMGEGLVPMDMTMLGAGNHGFGVLVLVVLVVRMFMVVLERFMSMAVLV